MGFALLWAFAAVDERVCGQTPMRGWAGTMLTEPGLAEILSDVPTAVAYPGAAAALHRFGVCLQAEKFTWPSAPRWLGAGMVLPAGKGSLISGLQIAGIPGFTQTTGTAGYAMPLADGFQLGLNFGILSVRTQGYAHRLYALADIGLLVRLHPQLRADLAGWNLARVPAARSDVPTLPRVIRSGITWLPGEHFGCSFALLMESGHPPAALASIRYRFHDRIAGQVWYSTAHQGMGLSLTYGSPHWQGRLAFGYMFPLGMLGLVGAQYLKPAEQP